MPDTSPEIPPHLLEKLSKLDLSNPDDLETLFALEAELQELTGMTPGDTPQSEPQENPSPAYLAAADPAVSLEEFIDTIGDDIHQTINSQSLLFPTCITASLEKSSYLLNQGLDPNHTDPDGYTPLIYATLPGDRSSLDLIQLLIAQGADLDATSKFGESPLKLLIRDGNYPGVQLLLTAGADPDPANFTPLHQAAALGDMEQILSLISSESLEEENCFERSPWLTAIHADQVSAAQLLQSQGANPKTRGQSGTTPLHLAAEANACNSIPYLLLQGSNPETRADFGNTALHNAVENDSTDAAQLLLDAGADIHALTESGDAPISFADSIPMLELLASHGANLDQPGSQGLRPLEHFAECGDLEALQWLLDNGAKLSTLPETTRTQIKTLLTT